jgi:hypothetical protein
MATAVLVELLDKARQKAYLEFAEQPDSVEYYHLICSAAGIVVAASREEDATNLWEEFLATHSRSGVKTDYNPQHCLIMPGRRPVNQADSKPMSRASAR